VGNGGSLAREWSNFNTGLRHLISEANFSDVRIHRAKIAREFAWMRHDQRLALIEPLE